MKKYLVSLFNDENEKWVYECFSSKKEAKTYVDNLEMWNYVSIEEITIGKCLYRPVALTKEEIVKWEGDK